VGYVKVRHLSRRSARVGRKVNTSLHQLLTSGVAPPEGNNDPIGPPTFKSLRQPLKRQGQHHEAGHRQAAYLTCTVLNGANPVEANVKVAVAVIDGTVHGDIVAQERVEIGPCAKIYGNIWTRSIGIKDGAIFDGVCTMIEGYPNLD